MCVLSTLCGNVDKHGTFHIYIYIYIITIKSNQINDGIRPCKLEIGADNLKYTHRDTIQYGWWNIRLPLRLRRTSFVVYVYVAYA